jgi:hypothetical protein
MVIMISKIYASIELILEKNKAKRSGENIVSPHPLILWNTIKYKAKKYEENIVSSYSLPL